MTTNKSIRWSCSVGGCHGHGSSPEEALGCLREQLELSLAACEDNFTKATEWVQQTKLQLDKVDKSIRSGSNN